MKSRHNIYNQDIPPGLEKISFKRKRTPDLLFFFVVVALPTSFFNFIPKSFFIDIKLVYLTIGVFFILFNFSYITKIKNIYGGHILLFVVSFIFFRYIYSIVVQNIPTLEALKVFRANFYYPIVTLGFLLYSARMDNSRLYRFFYWLLLVSFMQGVLYIIANLTGINFYANTYKEFYKFQGKTIIQNLEALPNYNMILFGFCVITVLTLPKYKNHWFWVIPLMVTILSIVRNQMIVHVLVLICFFVFGSFSILKIKASKLINALFFIVFITFLSLIIFPNHIGRVINKFGLDSNKNVIASSYTEEGTFKVRLDMISDSYNRTEKNNNLLLGNGYVREFDNGQRDLVFTGDTLVSPVIYTEGLLGLFIRCLPILYFLFFSLKNLRKKNKKIALFSLIIAALIVPAILNIVQTKIFVYYHHYLFIIYLLMLILYNDKKHPKNIYTV